MIGIDIIDRSFSFGRSERSLDQYKNKILQKAEFCFCHSWEDLDRLWAIKESAYKFHFKKGGSFFLNPKRILVVNIDQKWGRFTAEIDDCFYRGIFQDASEYVYAICCEGEPEGFFLQKGEKLDQNVEFLTYFEQYEQLSLEFHENGFPEYLIKGEAKYAYSRSHHGRYYISAISPFSHN